MSPLENGPQPFAAPPIPLLGDTPWQMSYGERAGLEGILSQLKPQLAVEIGTAQGGSLERLALHSEEVHSFDLVEPEPFAFDLTNVTFHTGDSHALLPEVLEQFAQEGRNVDFALVDGDHSTEGVRKDLEDLLNSPATASTVIILHDTMNEVVRAGIEQVEFGAWPKVAYVELDLIAGYMFRQPSLLHELWGGLGIVITDASRQAYGLDPRQQRYFEEQRVRLEVALLLAARDAILQEQEAADKQAEIDRLRAERDEAILQREAAWNEFNRLHATWASVMNSPSWKLTAPLRAVKEKASRVRR